MLLTIVNQYLEQKQKIRIALHREEMNGNSNNREQLQQELGATQDQVASIIESFVELGVSIYDFPGTPEASKGMITNLQRNVDRLYKLNVRSNDPQSSLSKVDIPLEVVQYIEDGRNPDIYTREFVEAIRRSNQYQRGKMHGLKQLRDSLADKIVDEFPELQKPVEDIIKRTSPIDDSSTAHQ